MLSIHNCVISVMAEQDIKIKYKQKTIPLCHSFDGQFCLFNHIIPHMPVNFNSQDFLVGNFCAKMLMFIRFLNILYTHYYSMFSLVKQCILYKILGVKNSNMFVIHLIFYVFIIFLLA